jgi:hypothetical protein
MFDNTIIMTRVRLDLEQLFSVNNGLFYLGRQHKTAEPLTLALANRVNYVIGDIFEIIQTLEPPKHDLTHLNDEEKAIMANYVSLKAGMVKSWEWIEGRESEIVREAIQRSKQGVDGE